MLRSVCIVPVVLGILSIVGCDADPLEERLQMRLDNGVVEIQSPCIGTCTPAGILGVTLVFDPDKYTATHERVIFAQYRIDYDIDGLDEPLPYFAATTAVTVDPAGPQSFEVATVGSAQREAVQAALGDGVVRGVATLSLAGHSYDDHTIVLEADFLIRFQQQPPAAGGSGANP